MNTRQKKAKNLVDAKCPRKPFIWSFSSKGIYT